MAQPCPACGRALPGDAAWCPACLHVVDAAYRPALRGSAAEASPWSGTVEAPRSHHVLVRPLRLLWLVQAAFGLLVVGSVGALAFTALDFLAKF